MLLYLRMRLLGSFDWHMFFLIRNVCFYLGLFFDRWRYSPKPSENNTEDHDHNDKWREGGNEGHLDEELGFDFPWSDEPNLALKHWKITFLGKSDFWLLTISITSSWNFFLTILPRQYAFWSWDWTLLELTPSVTHGQSMTGLPLHSQLITATPAIKPHIYANISTPLTASVNIDITQHNQHVYKDTSIIYNLQMKCLQQNLNVVWSVFYTFL